MSNQLEKEKIEETKVEEKVIEDKNKKEEVEEQKLILEEAEKGFKQVKENTNKKRTKIKIIISLVIIFVLAIFSTIFSIINLNNTKILSGVTINNIKLKGLTKEEAIILLQNEINAQGDIIINIDETDYSIKKENLSITYDAEKAVEEAYKQGRNNNIFVNNFNIAKNMIKGKNIKMEIQVDEENLQKEINNLVLGLPDGLQESTYYIEENNLVIKKGKAGKGINIEELARKIKESISNNNNEKINIKSIMLEPKEINLEEIEKEIYIEPKNAYYEKNPFKVYEHVNGRDFDVEAAKKMLEEDKEEYVIPLIITKPEITTDQIGTEAFPNLLGKCTTKYDESNVSRSTNLKVATRTINGMIIQSGKTFSYNGALGERTYEKGYRLGGGYVGGRNVDMIGGGICQISSTLYNAAIYANLQIVERHNHAHIAAYLDPGKDATVSYGTLDFKFKNSRKYPIMIKASAKNGIATVEIYGIKEEKEYNIEIVSQVSNYIGYKTIYEDDPTKPVGYEKVTQKGMKGCNSVTYKVYKLNGVEVSRELLSKDYFAPMNRYITRGTQGAATTTPETPAVPETPTVPEVPTETQTPAVPETPTTPTEPTEPTTPVEPQKPEQAQNAV